MSKGPVSKYVVELLGTFFLVLTIGTAAGLGHAGAMAPLAVGMVLIGLIYAGGPISRAHYNPAVTLAFWLRRDFDASDVMPYIGVQALGAGFAAALVRDVLATAPMQATALDAAPAWICELLFTFVLCWVILQVATNPKTAGNSYYGLAIGAVVCGAAFAVGPISGAVLNPAVAVGLAIMGPASWDALPLYFSAQLVAGVLAAVAYRLTD